MASDRVQQTKVLATKANDLSSIQSPHGKRRPAIPTSCFLTTHGTHMHVAHTFDINDTNFVPAEALHQQLTFMGCLPPFHTLQRTCTLDNSHYMSQFYDLEVSLRIKLSILAKSQ